MWLIFIYFEFTQRVKGAQVNFKESLLEAL